MAFSFRYTTTQSEKMKRMRNDNGMEGDKLKPQYFFRAAQSHACFKFFFFARKTNEVLILGDILFDEVGI